jgi:hypothetical protein
VSELILEIYDTKNIIEIETSIGNVFNNLDIETSTDKTVEIISGSSLGFISVGDILGLDDYLSNFIDSYEIDCGSP